MEKPKAYFVSRSIAFAFIIQLIWQTYHWFKVGEPVFNPFEIFITALFAISLTISLIAIKKIRLETVIQKKKITYKANIISVSAVYMGFAIVISFLWWGYEMVFKGALTQNNFDSFVTVALCLSLTINVFLTKIKRNVEFKKSKKGEFNVEKI